MAILLGDAFVRLGAKDDQLDADLYSARGKVNSWASGLASSVTKLAGGAVLGGIAAVTSAVAGIGIAAFNTSSEFDTATKKLQSQLGLTEEAAVNARDVIEGVFANNFGDSIADVGESVGAVESAFKRIGGAGSNLQKATESAIALRDAFGVEVNESTNAAVELMDKFGLTANEAFDFISAGFQRGLNSSDDFLDSITEYSTQFANGGADAGQFFSILETGLQGGVLGTDKAADAFKEFRLRINDGSTLTAQSLEALGLNAESITKRLADGSLTTAQVFDLVLDKLRETEDPTLRMQAAVGLIGTQFEDLGDSAVAALDLSKTKIDDLAGSTDNLNKQYETIPAFFEGLKRRALVAITPIGDALLAVANEALPYIAQAFDALELKIKTFIDNSSFEWTPEFKQVKLGDLFEFVQADGLGLTRIKVADWFDLTLGTTGIQKLTIGDFFDFVKEGEAVQLNIGDYVSFVQDTGFTKLTIGDLIDFVDTDQRTTINLGDYVSFVYDKTTGAVSLDLGDVFSFSASEAGTTFNLGDYVSFVWDGQGVTLTIGDVFTFDTSEGTEINLADYLVIKYDDQGEPVKIKVGDLYQLTTDGEKQTVNVGDYVEIIGTPTENIVKVELTDLFAFVAPVGWSSLLSLGDVPTITKLVFGDFFGFGGEDNQVTQDDLFDLSEKATLPEKYTLSDFIAFATGGKESTKFTISDIIDFEANAPEGFAKLSIGDFVVFNNGEESKMTWGDIFDFTKTPEVSKLSIGDLVTFETDEQGNITIESPVWDDFIDSLDWSTVIDAFAWADWIVKLIWPAATGSFSWSTFIDDLSWPTDTIDAFSWSTFVSALTWPLEKIISFDWSSFVPKITWPSAIADFSWRNFVTGVNLSALIPTFPGWSNLFNSINPFASNDSPSFDSGGSIGGDGRSTFGRPGGATVIIQNVTINNGQDVEEIAYTIAKRMAYA